MSYRNGNYTAFYVHEPFDQSNLRACASKDFCYYNLLKATKKKDSKYPFIDSHDKNYNVRDGSDWERTLKPRLHDRLANSKNIILFLSSNTKNSMALREEIGFGVCEKKLPVIVVYPEFKERSQLLTPSGNDLNQKIISLWDKLPIFRDNLSLIPTLHVPLKIELLGEALENKYFTVQNACEPKKYFYK